MTSPYRMGHTRRVRRTSLGGRISVDRPEALEYLQGRLGRGIQTRRESLPLEQRCWGIV
jgi:hypothetical protein